MGFLDDSDSEDDVSTCSEESVEEENARKSKTTAKERGVKTIKKHGSSVSVGSVEDRLDAIMSLKAEMRMDEDPEFLAKEKKKELLRKKQEEEEKRLEGLSLEERVQAQQSSVGDMMSLIKKKRELSKRNLLANQDGDDAPTKVVPVKAASKEDDEMEEFRRLKLKKANSKKKLMEKQKKQQSQRTAVAAN